MYKELHGSDGLEASREKREDAERFGQQGKGQERYDAQTVPGSLDLVPDQQLDLGLPHTSLGLIFCSPGRVGTPLRLRHPKFQS